MQGHQIPLMMKSNANAGKYSTSKSFLEKGIGWGRLVGCISNSKYMLSHIPFLYKNAKHHQKQMNSKP